MIYTGYADFWYRDVSLPERAAKFAAIGIHELDVWAWRSKGAHMDELAAACRENNVIFSDTFDEEPGSLTDANDHALCLDRWAESLEQAQRWGVKRLYMFSEQINPLPPNFIRHASMRGVEGYAKPASRNYTLMEKYANLIEGAHKVMALVEKTDITVWFESLNTYHLHGDITCTTVAMAADLVRRINHPRFRFTYDCYHQQRTAGNLIQGLHDYHGLYDAIHIADVPTRGEPGTGELNYANVAKALHELGYDADRRGRIGLEFYVAPHDEAAAFGRIKQLFENET